ncbi:hypothetical protein NIES267_57020 [Calothrix parasitica NIES-267]|uniref:KGK family protein n=1 Tax=Calothrix parasitica NIES-267 TaxID=1973488 RepID=A0A1Z4LY71_9CYAN|nr:hypothetical protein NIES267_57020 [Calothrix parasitica NIES-267]
MNDNNISIILDCDDDVVLFEKDTFKVSRLKELMIRKVIEVTHNRDKHGGYYPKFSLEIMIGEENFNFNYMKYETTKDCQILQVNNAGWREGKLNIEIYISANSDKLNKVNLEFFPKQPIEPESPLDDIREMIQVTDGA